MTDAPTDVPQELLNSIQPLALLLDGDAYFSSTAVERGDMQRIVDASLSACSLLRQVRQENKRLRAEVERLKALPHDEIVLLEDKELRHD